MVRSNLQFFCLELTAGLKRLYHCVNKQISNYANLKIKQTFATQRFNGDVSMKRRLILASALALSAVHVGPVWANADSAKTMTATANTAGAAQVSLDAVVEAVRQATLSTQVAGTIVGLTLIAIGLLGLYETYFEGGEEHGHEGEMNLAMAGEQQRAVQA